MLRLVISVSLCLGFSFLLLLSEESLCVCVLSGDKLLRRVKEDGDGFIKMVVDW